MALVSVLVATLGVGAASGAAYAEASRARPTSFCGTAKKLGEDVFTPNAATSGKITLKKIKQAIDKLGDEAPGSLKASFKTLSNFYDKYVSDLSDPEKLAAAARHADKATKAGAKIAKYLKKNCDIDVE